MSIQPNHAHEIRQALLGWYDVHARTLPWRTSPADNLRGKRTPAYRVWLSEIMLQQTQVVTVAPYFARFLEKWPDICALNQAPLDDVLKSWAGLGYYSRARNLKACAKEICNSYNGNFPQKSDELMKLPGIGPYTAAAIASIAFGEPVPVVDGNVERLVTRLFSIDTPLPKAKVPVTALVKSLLSPTRPGDFAQSMMDLGATICTPKTPSCSRCPLADNCSSNANGDAETYPKKLPRKTKPKRKGAGFVVIDEGGNLLLVKRSSEGLLGGMSAIHSTHWNARSDGAIGPDAAPFDGEWQAVGSVRHVFTHFALEMEIYWCRIADHESASTLNGFWVHQENVFEEALPSLMKKALKLALLDIASDSK